jgi:hypothetical protein
MTFQAAPARRRVRVKICRQSTSRNKKIWRADGAEIGSQNVLGQAERAGEDVAVVFMSLQFGAGAGAVAGMWHKSNSRNALDCPIAPENEVETGRGGRVIEQKLWASRRGPERLGRRSGAQSELEVPEVTGNDCELFMLLLGTLARPGRVRILNSSE